MRCEKHDADMVEARWLDPKFVWCDVGKHTAKKRAQSKKKKKATG